jgi:hypothetical protein
MSNTKHIYFGIHLVIPNSYDGVKAEPISDSIFHEKYGKYPTFNFVELNQNSDTKFYLSGNSKYSQMIERRITDKFTLSAISEECAKFDTANVLIEKFKEDFCEYLDYYKSLGFDVIVGYGITVF